MTSKKFRRNSKESSKKFQRKFEKISKKFYKKKGLGPITVVSLKGTYNSLIFNHEYLAVVDLQLGKTWLRLVTHLQRAWYCQREDINHYPPHR